MRPSHFCTPSVFFGLPLRRFVAVLWGPKCLSPGTFDPLLRFLLPEPPASSSEIGLPRGDVGPPMKDWSYGGGPSRPVPEVARSMGKWTGGGGG